MDDLGDTWSKLSVGIDGIMDRFEEGISNAQYMDLYSTVYNYCTGSNQTTHRENSNVIGVQLYRALERHLENRLNNLYKESYSYNDEELLQFYSTKWEKYITSMNVINHIFGYLNRNWIKREINEGKQNVYEIYNLALVTWRNNLFHKINNSLIRSLLQLIEKQRNGESIPENLIKNVIKSYVLLGEESNNQNQYSTQDDRSRSNDDNTTYVKIYDYYFEEPFIKSTEQYYKSESQNFINENSIVDYMRKAKIRIEEEDQRIDMYLNESSRVPLLKSCKDVLIKSHLEPIQDEFIILLQHDKVDDLSLMYDLLRHIPNSFDPLCKKYENYIKEQGLAAIERIAKADSNISGSTSPVSVKKEREKEGVDPKLYVEAILSVRKKYNDIIQKAFKDDPLFVESMDKACKDYINHNKICKTNINKSPELLARYSDSLLKKSNKISEESEIETKLKDIMIVFKYIEEKDVFQKFYSKMLAKRLVVGSSSSDDAEENMISKLKEVCGSEYTNKLQKMFSDISVSKDLNDNYNEFKRNNKIENNIQDFYILILSTACWPLHPPTSPFKIPSEIVKSYESFQTFYQKKFSGRKLVWLFQLCKGELKTHYLNVKYIFQVSTYQIAVLLLYNQSQTYSLEELQDLTGLNKDTLMGQLNILCKAKVLIVKSGPNGSKNFVLNNNFKYKKVRVQLNLPVRSEQQSENEETRKAIESDRNLLIQAAIVRIMKTRKVLKHVALVDEVISQLQSRFKPRIPDIKKNIDILFEKEYIERKEGEKDVYNYLA